MMKLHIGICLSLAACIRQPTPPVAPQPTAMRVTRTIVPGLDGLSGLAHATGTIYAVTERSHRLAYWPHGNLSGLRTLDIPAIPPGHDIEALAWLSPGHLVLATESQTGAAAQVLWITHTDAALILERQLDLAELRHLPALPLAPNRGAEGLCGDTQELLLALEQPQPEASGRTAMILRIPTVATQATTVTVPLTTSTGKLAALDCVRTSTGGWEVWAIERHYNVARVLRFDLPPNAANTRATPKVWADLGTTLRGLNLEGLIRLGPHHIGIITDNAGRAREGDSLYIEVAQ